MRVLNFGPDSLSRERFQILYQGFLFGSPQGGIRGIETLRRAHRILDKFAAISDQTYAPAPGGSELVPAVYPDTEDGIRHLKDEGGTMLLDDIEYNQLKHHFENVGWKSASVIPKALDAADFLLSAPQE